MVKKKGQVSIEYIATYGWAIIIVLGSLAALFYLNVFDLTPYVDAKCDFYSGIYCTEFLVEPTQITLALQNGLPIDISSVAVFVEDCGLATGQSTLTSGEETFYVATCSFNDGSIVDSTIQFNYTNPDSGIAHTKIGRVRSSLR